jgi:hypothetical protein
MSRNPLKLGEEELQILRYFERGEFESIQHFRKEKAQPGSSHQKNPPKG